jgi:hypothetical protein
VYRVEVTCWTAGKAFTSRKNLVISTPTRRDNHTPPDGRTASSGFGPRKASARGGRDTRWCAPEQAVDELGRFKEAEMDDMIRRSCR